MSTDVTDPLVTLLVRGFKDEAREHTSTNIVWRATPEDHAQALRNHSQSIEKLHERGGVTWCEFHAILYHKKWESMPQREACKEARTLLLLRHLKAMAEITAKARKA